MDIMRMGDRNPEYLGGWDLEDIPGKKLTLTIDRIVEETVVNAGQKEKCAVCYWREDVQKMILNVTNRKRIAKLYGTKDSAKLAGKRITITTERVKAFGDVYDALRVVPQIPPEPSAKKVLCSKCGKEIAPMGKMNSEQVAAYTAKKYGAALCAECATEAANAAKEATNESHEA